MKPLSSTLKRITVAAALLWAAQAAISATLYDPALGSLPSAQGWITTGVGPFTESVNAGHYQFGTLAANAIQAGSAHFDTASIDTAAGFTLDFNLRVVGEAHARDDRAGFSVIVIGQDSAHSLEIAFWGNHVWAYTDTFAHGADTGLDTSVARDYALVVKNNAYVLSADGANLFGGALVDYSAHGAPYNLAGFLFFGDDTTSARAQVELGAINIAAVPEPATTALLAAGLLALAWRGVAGAAAGRRAARGSVQS